MAGEVDFTAANGLFKKVYKPGVSDLRPKSSVIQRRVGFSNMEKLGESYNISVALQPPNGFTYAGSAGSVVALKQARNMLIKQATLSGFEIDLREQIAYKVLSSAVKAGEGAFKAATAEIVAGMQASSSNRIEGSILHGQRGYATVESVTDLGSNSGAIVITSATWPPGLFWAYGPGSTWDAFTSTTKNNGTAALILTKIDSKTRTLTFTYGGTLASEVAAGDVIYPEGAYTGSAHNDMPGLLSQASNTSGTSLGLSAATYPNWAGNTIDVAGPAGYGVVEDALSYLRDRGAEGGLTALVSSKLYSQLVTELAATRNLDASFTSEMGKQGMKGVKYFSPELGDVEILYHPFMKWGEFLVLPFDEVERVGSSDITFGIPGMDEQFFRLLDGYNAVEMQNFTDQAVCLKKPNHAIVATGVTY